MQCLEFAAQLGRHHSQLQALDTGIIVIGGGALSRAKMMAQTSRLPFPILADTDHRVYEHYGLVKKLLLIQQSGTFLIDKQGIVRHITRVTNPSEWFGRDEITNLLKSAANVNAGA